MRRPTGAGLVRGKCLIQNCTRIQKLGGKTRSGQRRYKPYCSFHCKFRNIENPPKDWFKNNIMKDTWIGRQMIENGPCSICGWDEGPCDRHRIKPKRGYVKGNTKILCPNHHRLVTMGLIDLESKPEPIRKFAEEKVKEENYNLCQHGAMIGLCRFGCKK